MFTNEQHIGLLLWAWVKKKKIQAQQLVKKVMFTIFWDMKVTISIALEKGATINSAS